MSRSVKVSVAGQQLAIKTTAKPQYVRDLAAFVTHHIDDVRASGGQVTTQSLALLAAMNIADELHRLRHSQAQLRRQVREKTNNILRYLDSDLDSSSR